MSSDRIEYMKKIVQRYLAAKTGMVDHKGVLRAVASGVEPSWIYYLMLLLSGLIALLGLLINSVAVVIGAMLISPLMEPIISCGLAFTIGDLALARRAFRTIAVSVAATIVVTTLMTLLSPLKEQTAEIMARVRPNIYDLMVAMLSGVAGTVALCTKRNYLITASGVAVATAVIPPLSVVGFCLGTADLKLAGGGFLLFFTNFVAIILTSDLVFFLMGFRPGHVETIRYSQRTRLLIMAAVLVLVSIPLAYTLRDEVKALKAKKRVEQVLKAELDRKDGSSIVRYSYRRREGGAVVSATVDTARYISKRREQQVKTALQKKLGVPVDLQLEQLLLASGEKLPGGRGGGSSAADVKAPGAETPAQTAAKVGKLVSVTEEELDDDLAPFPVTGTMLSFSGDSGPVRVTATVKRDYPVRGDERLLLSRQLERLLGIPVRLVMDNAPLLPALEFGPDGELAPATAESLAVIKELPAGAGFRFVLTTPAGEARKVAAVRRYLTERLGVPEKALSVRVDGRKTAEMTLRVLLREK